MKRIVILFILFLVSLPTFAGNEPLSVFGDWTIFKTVNKDKKLLCYSVSLPIKRYDNFNKRGESFFVVIKEKDFDNLEIYASYGQIWKKGIKSAMIDIAKRKYPLYTYEDKAYAYNIEDDKSIIENLSKSALFNLSIDFNGDKKLMDIYSLNGFKESIEEIKKLCN